MLFTPDSTWDQFRDVWEARVATYRDLLAPHGIEIEPVSWTDARPTRPALALLAWGYHLQPVRWETLLAMWGEDVPLINAPALLKWNSDKRYLDELAGKGVPVVPTRFVGQADADALAEARAAFGAEELVVKPRVSAAASYTSRVGPNDPAPNLADAMIQSFVPSVQTTGELSVFFFEGRRAHAVRKVAAPGDFRVQREYGGLFAPAEPSEAERRVAETALASLPTLPFYARVDMVPDAAGAPQVMEIELIEPDLYLDLAPDRGERFAQALARKLKG